MSSNPVRQTGNITPGHIAVWTADGTIADGGTSPQPPQTNIKFIEQSGNVTPTHLAKWVTTGVMADGGALASVNDVLLTGIVASEPTRALAIAATIPSFTTAIEVFGYYTVGDGGAAIYTKTTGSTIGGFQSADGAWWQLEIHSERVFVKQFGAKGDGGTDDSAAIQAAHDYLFNAGVGGTVIIDNGTFAIATGLNFNSRISLQGNGRNASILLATAPITMLSWYAVGAGPAYSAGSVRDITFEGNSVATNGVILGFNQNYLMEQVQIQYCTDNGLVLAGAQNSLFNVVFVQQCGLANYRLAGSSWNNDFIRCGGNEPSGVAGYDVLSRIDPAIIALTGAALGNNRHNTFYHLISERGTPLARISLEDDSGANAFYSCEIVDAPGKPLIYISNQSVANHFYSCTIQDDNSGGPFASTMAIENNGFGTVVFKCLGIGWNGRDWISNTAPGTVEVTETENGGTILNISPGRSAHTLVSFQGGQLVKYEGNDFVPYADDTYYLGKSNLRWKFAEIIEVDLNICFIYGRAFNTLPSNFPGYIATINDSNTNTWGATIAGGGGFTVLAFNNGSAWTVIGK